MNMRTKEELIREIEDRNKARVEADLPLVSVPKEVERIYEGELEQECRQDFHVWCEAHQDLCKKIAEEVLQAFRKERGNPTWLPRGLLNGAWAYGSEVRERLEKIWKKERSEAQSDAAPASKKDLRVRANLPSPGKVDTAKRLQTRLDSDDASDARREAISADGPELSRDRDGCQSTRTTMQ